MFEALNRGQFSTYLVIYGDVLEVKVRVDIGSSWMERGRKGFKA